MKIKRIMALLLVLVLVSGSFAGCSNRNKIEPIDKISVVADDDDGQKVVVDPNGDSAFEIKDSNGNTLKLIPIFDKDAITIIAGYIESAKDINGNELTAESFANLQRVVALEIDAEGNYSIKYNSDGSYFILEALADEEGLIIAISDKLDLDNDKDTKEYLKCSTLFDSEGNILIKLDKDDSDGYVNVKVEVDDKGDKTVTDSSGNKHKATDTHKAKNLSTVQKERTQQSQSGNNNNNQPSGNNNNSSGNNQSNPEPTPPPEEETIDYVPIVLKSMDTIACDADNVSVTGSSASGGVEVIVDGPGPYSKYYITSETGVFTGQIEFRFNIGDDVEVKFNNVNISTGKKTAVKFTDVDKENFKESDTEETGAGLGSSGSSYDAAAPLVELSFTGTNSFKAGGSGKNGTIYSECKIGIKGHGTAYIDGGQNLSGICSTESMSIKNATLNITSSAKQGISCDRKVTINDGANITINSVGDCIHSNKLEMNGGYASLSSMYDTNCADGIDTNDWIIINGGSLNVYAPTAGKYGVKVRKVEKGNPNGLFDVVGGSVSVRGYYNSPPTTDYVGVQFIDG